MFLKTILSLSKPKLKKYNILSHISEWHTEWHTELLDKIYDRGVAGTQSASQSATLSESEDFVMTETTISTKCPITGKEMAQPVKNVHCDYSIAVHNSIIVHT